MAETIAAIEAHGWLPKSRALPTETPTASRATDNLFALCQRWPACGSDHATSHRDTAPPTEAQLQEADATLTWVREHFEDADMYALDDYENNLRVATVRDWIESREVGLAASAVSYYRRAIQKEIERAERAKQRAEAGPAPEGRVAVRGTVSTIKEYASDFGGGYYNDDAVVVKMTVILENGSRVWVTVPSNIDPKPGDVVEFRATFTRAEDDPTFAKGKRPSNARIADEEKGEAPCPTSSK